MKILGVSFAILATWWLAFALSVVRDNIRRVRLRANEPQPARETDSEPFVTATWPLWRDYLARPTLFIAIPFVFLLHALVFILIWPSFPLHRLFFPELYKPRDDRNKSDTTGRPGGLNR